MSLSYNEVSRRTALKALAVGGLTLAAGTSLAGCAMGVKKPGSTTEDGKQKQVVGERTGKEIVIYMNAGHVYKTYTDLFARFEKEHKIKITVNPQQWSDMQTKLTAGFLSGDVPDLCEETGTWWAPRWGTSGDVMPLDDYIKRDGAAIGFPGDFVDSGVKIRQANGHTYAIPLHLTCMGLLFYNKDMLSAAGLEAPKTWADFENASKELTGNGVYGTALNQDSVYSLAWLLQSGAEYFDPASKKFLTPTADAKRALQLQQDLVHKFKVSPTPVASVSYSGPQKMFSAKKAAMMLSGPWDINPIHTGSPDLDFGLAEPLTGQKQATSIAGAGLMIPARSQNADLAWELIKQLTALKTSLAASAETGMTMPRKSWAETPEIKNDPLLGVVARSLPVAQSTDYVLSQNNRIASISTAYSTMYQQIVSQQVAVDTALDTFQNTVKSYV